MLTQKYIHIMKRFAAIALCILAAVPAVVSCSDEIDIPTPNQPDEPEANCITLKLKCNRANTRVENYPSDNPIEPGIEDNNENKIETVTIFLSPLAGDATDEDNALIKETFSFTSPLPQNQVVIKLPLNQDIINTLFKQTSDNKCRAFAAVNVNAESATTISDLKNMEITSTFESKQVQDKFAMYGECEVSYDDVTKKAAGTVEVNRTAAKIELSLDVDDEIKEETADGTVTWKPDLSKMSVRLQQGLGRSSLVPGNLALNDDDFFNTPYNLSYTFEEKQIENYERYDRVQKIPFYTYPHEWTDSETEKHGSFMILSVPWTPDDGTSWRTCYYHVPILPTDQFEIIRNHSYHVRLHVGMLGSFVPEVPMEITGEYYIAPWGEDQNMEIEINDYRYLVVDQNVYTVNNESEIFIPFYTSHETVVTDVEMTFYRYNFSDQGSEFAVTVDSIKNKLSFEKTGKRVFDAWFDNQNDNLIVKHNLKIFDPYNERDQRVSLTQNLNGTRDKLDNMNSITAVLNSIKYYKESVAANNDEYSRIKYVITVQHKDVYEGNHISPNLFKEKVEIYQYPGMYITAVQNYADQLGDRDGNGYYWSSGAQGSTMISGRYTKNTNYSVTNTYSNFWTALPKSTLWAYNTNRQTAEANGQIYTNATNTINYGSWSNTGLNNFYLAFNYFNWNYSLGLDADFGNWNPNMYLVTVTNLPKNTNYIIDDPRSYYINNFLSNESVKESANNKADYTTTWNGNYYYFQKANGSGPETSSLFGTPRIGNPLNTQSSVWNATYWMEYAVKGFIDAEATYDGPTRKLKYYYPTREDASAQNVIAPKFRICSSYGGSSAFMTREMSRRRAAAYQEMGYSAGRWRLPTEAEVRFMIDLAAQEKIPRLFGANGTARWNYWCAQGAISVPGRTAADQSVYIDAYPRSGGSNPDSQPVYPTTYLFTGDNYRDHTRFVYDEWYWGETTLPAKGTVTAATTQPVYTFTWGDRPKTNPEQ